MKCFTHSFVLCLFLVGYSSQNSLEAAKRFGQGSNDGYTFVKKGLSRGLVSLRKRSYVKGTSADEIESPTDGNGAKPQIRKREATINKMLNSINLNLFNPDDAHGEFKREAHYSGSAELGENTRTKRQAEDPEGGSGEQPPPRKGGRGGRRGRRGRGCGCKNGGGKGDTPAEPKEGAAEGGEEEKRRKRELFEDEGEALDRVRRQDAPEGGDEPPRNGGRGGGRGGGRRGGRGGRGRRCRCPKPGDKKAPEEPSGEAPAEEAAERKKRETVAGPEEVAPWGKSGVSPRRLHYAPEAGIKHRQVHVGVVVLMHHRHRPSSNVNYGRELAESNVLDKVENSDRKKREDTGSEVAGDKSEANPESPRKKDKKLKHLKSHHLKRLYNIKYDKKTVTDLSKSSNMDEKVDRRKREADDEDNDDDDESKEKVPSAGARSVPGDKDTPGCYGKWKYGGGGRGGGGGGGGASAGGGGGGAEAEAGGEVGEYKKAAKYKLGKGKKKSKG